MTCKQCGGGTDVVDSRFVDEKKRIRKRRHVCAVCGFREFTVEIPMSQVPGLHSTRRIVSGHETAVKIRFLLSEGFTLDGIAEQVGLSRRTIWQHTQSSPVRLKTAAKITQMWQAQQGGE